MAVAAGEKRESWDEWEREQDAVGLCLTFLKL
jgi:hypothetical protein